MRRSTQIRTNPILAVRVAALAAALGPATFAQEARELLAKVADRYRAPKTFEAVAVRDTAMRGRSSNMRSSSTFRTVFAQPDRYRVEPIDGEFSPIERMSDGETIWMIQHDRKEYTETPVRRKDPRWGAEARFAVDPDSVEKLVIEGDEMLGAVPCRILSYKPKPPQNPDPRAVIYTDVKLWVEPATGIVWKAVDVGYMNDPFAGRRDMETTHFYRSVKFEEEIPLERFRFQPPEGYKLVGSLQPGMVARPSVSLKGKPAPDFTLRDTQGEEVRLSDLKGKAVLLNFWATWCQPCLAEMPFVELLSRSFASKGLVVLGINNEPNQVARKHLDGNRYTIRSLHDPDEAVRKMYGADGIPTTYLINREGLVVEAHIGSMGNADLKSALEQLGIW
jgi:peroxiredoxin/outer membrane lipoprotein-sorting protein